MPKLFGFSDEATARRLKRTAMLREPSRGELLVDDCDAWLIRTPAAGIAAFTGYDSENEGDVVPSAYCAAWLLYEDDDGTVKRMPEIGEDDAPLEILVANLDSAAIPGNAWGGCTKYVGGIHLLDWFDCNA